MLFEEFTEGLRNPADNPCWKGYYPVGTKQKGGRTVPNCVPRNEGVGDSTLQVGDPVIITGNVEYQGRTGDVREIGRDGSFVVVNLYNHGPHSFHSSDVSFNDYADSDEEDERAQGVTEDDDLNDYYSGYYADLLSQIENMSAADQVDTKLGIKRSLENNEIRLVDLKTEIKSLERELKKLSVAEQEKVGNMPADKFDDAMARLKKLAGAGPLKTVWDPQKRVYRNMPTAVQPKK